MIPASLLGIASPLCMYGTIPLAAAFSRQGIKDDMLSAFMMSSILLNPQLIIYSRALGQEAVLIRCVSCFLCGCCAGWLIRAFYGRKDGSFFGFTGFHEGESRDTDLNMILRFLKNVGRNIRATGPMFLLEILLWSVVLLAGWLLGGPVGIGTVLSTFGAGAVMRAVYSVIRFEPRALRHKDILEVTKILLNGE